MSTSLNLLGATLTSNSTTSVADFSNFAKVKVAASNENDAAARNDYVNNKITDLGNSVLKLSPSTETISSSGAITANKSYLSVMKDANSSNILSTINATNGLVNGSVIVLQANNPSSSITVSNNPKIILNNHLDCILNGYNTLQLIYSNISNSWLELSRTSIPVPRIQAVISFPYTDHITLTVANVGYPLGVYVNSNNTSGMLRYSFSEQTAYYTFYYGSYNGGLGGHITPKANGGPFAITVYQDENTSYFAAQPATLYITINLTS